jgi:membrane-associated phospholipid phosphatase
MFKRLALSFVLLFPSLAAAQSPPAASTNTPETCGFKHLQKCLLDLAHDQAGIWTSPLRIKPKDAVWLVPFAGATGAAIHYDADAQRELGISPNRIDTSRSIARFGSAYATLAGGIGLYALGSAVKSEKLSETGRLGAEAVIDASIVVEGLKLATNRERPEDGTGTGRFWPHGTRQYLLNSSFPSGHSAASWALARVVAEEYPGWLPKLTAYGFATTISIARVTGRNHFPSDSLVGATFGYLIGGYVYRHHSSEASESTSPSLTPIVDQRTKTYGAHIEFPAHALIHPGRMLRELLHQQS